MPTISKKPDFFDTEEGAAVEQALRRMEADAAFKTDASYSANVVTHPDHKITFVEKHKNYIKQHQNINPQHYLSNLRLMTKLK